MKYFAGIILLGLAVTLIACGGGNSSSGNINGNWSATLTGSQDIGFTTSFTQGSGSTLNVANFTFTTQSPCFSSSTTETGSFTLSGNSGGNVQGNFGMTISTMFPPGQTNNELTLQGTVNSGTVSGNWNLTGAQTGCTGTGSFTMTAM
jgi:hypothetical protein